MNERQFRKAHSNLFKLWVKHKFRFGDNPTPQEDKNYILAVVNDSTRCFVILEYNDGWVADSEEGKVQDINIPSVELMSYYSSEISENNFTSLLLELIQIFSEKNELIICNRTNGPGKVVFNILRKEVFNMLELDNVRFFPTSRRSKYGGKELFPKLACGWEMSVADEKNCFDAMRTAQGQGYFTLATDKSKQSFELTSVDEIDRIEPFFYCWLMLSYIRLATMNLFND